MRSFIFFFLFSFSFSLHASEKKNAVIKTSGDTVWCDTLEIKYNVSEKVKKVILTGASVNEIVGEETAFVLLHGKMGIVGTDGYFYNEVVIFGANYYMTATNVTYYGTSVSNTFARYDIFDKNRKHQTTLDENKAPFFRAFRKYFSDCDEFVKEMDKAEQLPFKVEKWRSVAEDLIVKYNSSCAKK